MKKTTDQVPNQHLLARFFFFFGAFLFGEIILHLFLYKGLSFNLNLLYIFLFTFFYAWAAVFLSGLFSAKTNFIIALVTQIIVTFLFGAQYIYYLFFKMPLLIYSIFNAGQVTEFAGVALKMIVTHLPQLLVFFLPLIVLIVWGRRLFTRMKRLAKVSCLVIAITLFFLATGILRLSGTAPSSAYNLYYNENSAYPTQEKLGVLTATQLDLKRTIFGFSPKDTPGAVNIGELTNRENEEEIPAVIYEPNMLDIDFDTLISEETDDEIIAMHRYFSSLEPSLKNDYTGIFEGCNLIYITAEGFYYPLLDLNLYPTLQALATEGLEFTNFYNPIWPVSTSDGEYIALTGLIPESGVWSFSRSSSNYLPFVMGNQFAALGYPEVRAYHDHNYTYYDRNLSHPNMGYDFEAVNHGLDIQETWPESDLEMAEASVDDFINAANFHVYYLTVSGHLEYNFFGNNMAMRHEDEVADLPYSDAVRAYVSCNLELEYMLDYLLARLEEAGQLDNTVIALSADHYPYGLSDEAIDELVGHPVEKNFELYRNTFILWKPGMTHQIVNAPMSTLDILPTISNLFALPYDSRLLMGRDVFSDTPAVVVFNNRSWITDYGSYNAETGEITGDLSPEYVGEINELVAGKFIYSAKILDTDYYQLILGE